MSRRAGRSRFSIASQARAAASAPIRQRHPARAAQLPLSTSPAPFTASRLPCTRRSSSIRVSRSAPVQTRQQAAFAFQRDHDDLVMGGVSLRRQRDRIGARILLVGLDGDQPAPFQRRQRAADRALVEADHVTDAGCGNLRLDREQRQDPPLRDVDAKTLLIEHGGAARQLVGDEGDEGRDVTVEIEHLFGPSPLAAAAGAPRAPVCSCP